jgi:hypothetical protein
MQKWFNTAGPCKADIHYMLPAVERLPEIQQLIAQENYFVVHAPRQTGKTTVMLTLAQKLTASGQYTSVMLSLEVGAVFSHDPEAAERAILDEWQDAIRFYLPAELQPSDEINGESGRQIGSFLHAR